MSTIILEWESYKERLDHLYRRQNLSLKQVLRCMKDRYGFEKSPGQYERQFKKWDWKKNVPSAAWASIDRQLSKRTGRISEVLKHGRPLSPRRLRKELARHVTALSTVLDAPSPPTDSGILVKSPGPPGAELATSDHDALLALRNFIWPLDAFGGTWLPLTAQELRCNNIWRLPTSSCLNLLHQKSVQTTAEESVMLPLKESVMLPLKASEDGLVSLSTTNFGRDQTVVSRAETNMSFCDSFLRTEWLSKASLVAPAMQGSRLTKSACDAALARCRRSDDAAMHGERFEKLGWTILLLANKIAQPSTRGMQFFQDFLHDSGNVKMLENILIPGNIGSEALCENLLHHSVRTQKLNLLVNLLRLGCDPNQQVFQDRKRSLLTVAAESGNLSVVKALVDAGANVNGVKLEKAGVESPLYDAVQSGSVETARYLLDHGAKINCKEYASSSALTALAVATWAGNLELTRLLLDYGASVNAASHTRNSALYLLIDKADDVYESEDRLLVLNLLIEAGVFIDAAIIDSVPAVMYSEFDDSVPADEYSEFDDRDYNWNLTWEPSNALELSASRGNTDFVAALLARGARVSNRTMLFASEAGSSDCVYLLLAHRRSGSVDLPYGYRILQNATQRDDLSLAKALLEVGVPTDEAISCSKGYTSGDESEYDSECDMERDEQELACIPDDDRYEETPLRIAASIGSIDMVRLLLAAGAVVDTPVQKDATNDSSETLLELAARSGRGEIVKLLLEAGACVRSLKRVLAYAVDYAADLDLVQRLIEAGADVNSSADTNSSGQTPLQRAVASGNHAITHALLDAAVDVNAVENTGSDDTAFCIAIKRKDWYLFEVLLGRGANLNGPNGSHSLSGTPLSHAVMTGSSSLVSKLLQLGSDPNDSAALAAAVLFHNLPLVSLLLRSCQSSRKDPHYGCAALHLAIRKQDRELVQVLLDEQVRVDISVIPNPQCRKCEVVSDIPMITSLTALGAALEFDKTADRAIVRAVLSAGSDPNHCVDYTLGYNALQKAAANQSLGDVQLLLQAGADLGRIPQAKSHEDHLWSGSRLLPIFIATARGNLQMVSFLLEHGAVVDENREGVEDTILAIAARHEDLGLIRILLNAGASLNADGPEYVCTALETAVQCSNFKVAEFLLEAGARACGSTKSRHRSILCTAVEKNDLLMVKLLLEAGADPNSAKRVDSIYGEDTEWTEYECSSEVEPQSVQSAIQRCAANGYIDCAALLVSAGANVNHQAVLRDDTDCSEAERKRLQRLPHSALEEAARIGHIDMLQLLLDAGAKTYEEGAQQYHRALRFASSNCHHAAIRLLQRHHQSQLTTLESMSVVLNVA